MTTFHRVLCTGAMGCAMFMLTVHVYAHGFAGDRFFPPTITTDDPFAADELALPTISYFENPGSPNTRETDIGFEFDKLIIPNLSLGISDQQILIKSTGSRATNGWDEIQLSAKYVLWVSTPHEAIFSVGLVSDIGGTGTKRIGSRWTSNLEPALYFGKGFGDLPDSLDALKPFAVTGVLGEIFPFGRDDPNALEWGISLQYQLPYLEQHVKDIGLPKPLRDMIPLVEFAFDTPENRHGGGTTGTINPGILWETKYAQFGAEALIPVNRESGAHVGAIFQVWIFLDDLFPKKFGHPLFGGDK
jgi:hypothetical protein